MDGTRPGKRLGRILVVVFVLALIMGPGPGLLLVNRAEQLSLLGGFKLPYLYAWGLLWYGVEAACVVLAYFFVWREPGEDQEDRG